ncbi:MULTISPECIES: AzlC family ABC transporter permease [Priestia]|uniref:Branched-chain amino acid ABC transporter permease n=2 Tax=Priestia megaterium TaxID=1404 RepID=A0A6M6DPM6_PRIMG|nr:MULTISPECIES: AzlC family ABC transporter permease [Priestia]MCJ7989776.1 AzlC family ABC transporter permease [Priestia sp. OVS21]AJI22602.1 azlC family protein [Priestia megaterium NBRC 15308 = ATCC 14581]KFN05089.1 azlC family protein [Priestia megaterium]KGJ77410.1 branched-chain amino acid ABC transporter permease [Priestia megaterium NBRC 15308 = ATCC 14581]KLV31477.1 branched-chain amino acid ABC transporter permease [Priestia megaterium]
MIAEKAVQQREKVDLTFRQGAKDCIPTLLGYISIGLAAGIVGVSSHLSVMEVALLSALVYAGAAQFIICALMVANSSISAIILTTFIVNLRHFLLSATVAPEFTKYSLLKNVGIGALLTDESFGVSSSKIAKGEPINDRWMNGLNITAYVSWIIACTAGAIFGHMLSNPEAFGFDFALTAMFLALLVLQIESVLPSKLNHYLRLILYMAIIMIVLSFFVPSHVAVLISTIIVATIGVVTDK